MLGFLLIYFIGKQFYELAGDYLKNRWGFAIAGVVIYYGGVMTGSVLAVIIMEIIEPGSSDGFPDIALGAMGIPFGLLACWGFYKLLENNWKKTKQVDDGQALDAELMK